MNSQGGPSLHQPQPHHDEAVLADHDATRLAELVRERVVSCTALVAAVLARLRRLDPQLNSHTVVFADDALAQAEKLDARLSAGHEIGPLGGVPISVKDVIWTAGAPATNGSAAFRHFVAPADATAVARVRRADAIVIGKTNNPEFCFRGITDNTVYGLSRNPWDLDRTPGGSSGGSGAAVAAGIVPIALGTDGGGSIRIPAAFCGVNGFMPSADRVPRGPGFRGWETLATDGYLARSARDLALCFDVVKNDLPSIPAQAQDIRSLRIGYSADLGFAPVEDSVRHAFEQAISLMHDAGWNLTSASPETGDPNKLWTEIALAEGYAAHRETLTAQRDNLEPDTIALLEAGSEYSATDYLDAMYERRQFSAMWSHFFEQYDILLCPTMQLTAFPVGITAPTSIAGHPLDPLFDDWCSFCLPSNLNGQPAISVPCGLSGQGLPIGLQIVAPRYGDERALAVAAAWQELSSIENFVPPLTRQ